MIPNVIPVSASDINIIYRTIMTIHILAGMNKLNLISIRAMGLTSRPPFLKTVLVVVKSRTFKITKVWPTITGSFLPSFILVNFIIVDAELPIVWRVNIHLSVCYIKKLLKSRMQSLCCLRKTVCVLTFVTWYIDCSTIVTTFSSSLLWGLYIGNPGQRYFSFSFIYSLHVWSGFPFFITPAKAYGRTDKN
jgi:hypothetical protein